MIHFGLRPVKITHKFCSGCIISWNVHPKGLIECRNTYTFICFHFFLTEKIQKVCDLTICLKYSELKKITSESRTFICQHLVHYSMRFSDVWHNGGEIVDHCHNFAPQKRLKFSQTRLTQFIRKENIGSKSDINNKMLVNVERDAESNDR